MPSPPHKVQLIAHALGIADAQVMGRLDDLHRSVGSYDALVAHLGGRGVPVSKAWLSERLRAHRHALRVGR